MPLQMESIQIVGNRFKLEVLPGRKIGSFLIGLIAINWKDCLLLLL